MWVWISRWGGVLDTTLCDWVCQWFAAGLLFSTGTPVSSTNKTDRHIFNWNIVESGIKDHNNNLNPTKMYLYTPTSYYNYTKMIMNAG